MLSRVVKFVGSPQERMKKPDPDGSGLWESSLKSKQLDKAIRPVSRQDFPVEPDEVALTVPVQIALLVTVVG